MFNIYNKNVCVCVCAPARNHFNSFLIQAESTLNIYCLINNPWIKVLFMYTHNENKTDVIHNITM